MKNTPLLACVSVLLLAIFCASTCFASTNAEVLAFVEEQVAALPCKPGESEEVCAQKREMLLKTFTSPIKKYTDEQLTDELRAWYQDSILLLIQERPETVFTLGMDAGWLKDFCAEFDGNATRSLEYVLRNNVTRETALARYESILPDLRSVKYRLYDYLGDAGPVAVSFDQSKTSSEEPTADAVPIPAGPYPSEGARRRSLAAWQHQVLVLNAESVLEDSLLSMREWAQDLFRAGVAMEILDSPEALPLAQRRMEYDVPPDEILYFNSLEGRLASFFMEGHDVRFGVKPCDNLGDLLMRFPKDSMLLRDMEMVTFDAAMLRQWDEWLFSE